MALLANPSSLIRLGFWNEGQGRGEIISGLCVEDYFCSNRKNFLWEFLPFYNQPKLPSLPSSSSCYFL
jgi:hypothetical protein